MRKPYVQTTSDAARRARVWLDHVGYFAVRLQKGAVEVAAAVRFEPTPDPSDPDNPQDRTPMWSLWIDLLGTGQCVLAEGPSPQITWSKTGRPIDHAEFVFLLEDRAWAKKYAPDSPEAQPHKRVDVSTLPPPSFD